MAQKKQFGPLPAPGNIVYCRFPQRKGVVGPKPRPALVVGQVALDDGTPGLQVAYGTSQKTNDLHSGEFAIRSTDAEAFQAAGLSYDTKFDLGNCETLPYDEDWFSVPKPPRFGNTPKLGVLHPSLFLRAKAAYDAAKAKKPK